MYKTNYDILKISFDITEESSKCLSSEDRRLYHLQIETKVWIGYAKRIPGSSKTIHPFKRRKMSTSTKATPISLSTSQVETETKNQAS